MGVIFLLNLLEVVLILIIITVSLLIHEMGHAIATVLQNKESKADIYILAH